MIHILYSTYGIYVISKFLAEGYSLMYCISMYVCMYIYCVISLLIKSKSLPLVSESAAYPITHLAVA